MREAALHLGIPVAAVGLLLAGVLLPSSDDGDDDDVTLSCEDLDHDGDGYLDGAEWACTLIYAAGGDVRRRRDR